MKIRDASYFLHLPLFYIFEGVKVGHFSLLIDCFHIIQNSEQGLIAVVQTSSKIAFACDDEWFLFKQIYLRQC
jgi:hypothetical protein